MICGGGGKVKGRAKFVRFNLTSTFHYNLTSGPFKFELNKEINNPE